MAKIRLGISACLLGENVRYDGGHALNEYLRNVLGRRVEYLPVCPEAGCGLGIPRETMRLTGDIAKPLLITTGTKIDHTQKMENWARNKMTELASESLRGFIFKSRSPSCGMERVKVYDANEMFQEVGVGILARIFREYFPLLPVADETRLQNQALRQDFLRQIFA